MINEKIKEVIKKIERENYIPVYLKEREYILAYCDFKKDFVLIDIYLTLENKKLYKTYIFEDNNFHYIDLLYDLIFWDGEIIQEGFFYQFLVRLFKELDLIYSIERKKGYLKKEIVYFDNYSLTLEQKTYVNEGGFEYGSWLAYYLEDIFAFIPLKKLELIRTIAPGGLEIYSLKDLPL